MTAKVNGIGITDVTFAMWNARSKISISGLRHKSGRSAQKHLSHLNMGGTTPEIVYMCSYKDKGGYEQEKREVHFEKKKVYQMVYNVDNAGKDYAKKIKVKVTKEAMADFMTGLDKVMNTQDEMVLKSWSIEPTSDDVCKFCI